MKTENLDYKSHRKAASLKKRQAILRAAGRSFSERGFKNTTAAEIASRASVSKGLVFHLFGSKAALFESVVEDSLLQWSELSNRRASAVAGDSNDELKHLFLASFEFAEQYPMLLFFLREDGVLLDQYKNRIAQANRRWRRRVEEAVKSGIEDKFLRKGIDVKRTAIVFHKLQTSLLQSMYVKGAIRPVDKLLANEAIEMLLHGIAVGR